MQSLQPVLVPTDPSKLISVFINEDLPEDISVFFGLVLLEKINSGKNSLQLKLLISRLYNMKYSRKELVSAFGFSRKTIQCWGEALKEGNIDEINRVLSGNSSRRKLTSEIEQFARLRFNQTYKNNSYSYSSEIRNEIETCFEVKLSSESLRTIFSQEKQNFVSHEEVELGEAICDLDTKLTLINTNNRKQIPSSIPKPKLKFSFHAGLYLLLSTIYEVTDGIE